MLDLHINTNHKQEQTTKTKKNDKIHQESHEGSRRILYWVYFSTICNVTFHFKLTSLLIKNEIDDANAQRTDSVMRHDNVRNLETGTVFRFSRTILGRNFVMQIDATLQLEVMFPNDKKKIDVEISNFIA
jgi:hypothetical protein